MITENLIIKNAVILDKTSPFHTQKMDLKITNGFIEEINTNISNSDNYKLLELNNLHISNGWFDTSISLGEPGFEDRETIENGLNVAAKSGFTAIALQPNTFPIVDNQVQVAFVQQKAHSFATQLFPIGALTQKSEGNHIAELFDMKIAGAVAFGDYNRNTGNGNLLKIALQYSKNFSSLILTFCQDSDIRAKGIVNEGITSTSLGIKGIPTLAEELSIAKNIAILEYTGGKLHIPTISSNKSVRLIREAKAKGLQISCSVSVHHLALNDSVLTDFDTRYKVLPPICTEFDRKSLLEGLLDNTIDCITSDHNPISIEHKKVEFDYADFGTIGLESAYTVLQNILPTNVIVDKLTAGRTIFNQGISKIEVGQNANLSMFTPSNSSFFTEDLILSKSKNSALLNCETKGSVYGIYNQKQLIIK